MSDNDPTETHDGNEPVDNEAVDPDSTSDTEQTRDEPLTEDDYALGETSDPDGAVREEPAGEDYAGSGF